MESPPASPGKLLAGVILCLPVKVNGNELIDKCVSEEHLKNMCISLQASTDPLVLGKVHGHS